MAQYTRVSGIVGLITLQNPPVNALSAAVRQGIVDTVETALSDPEVKSVVICGQNGNFCGGADIKEFGTAMFGPPLIPMIHAIEAANKPMVAAIEGSALGGGLELALGCHYRIAHSKARLGLPEVTLGLLPAAGGSQRLPRLIGVPAALNLITTGRHVTAAEALQLGIVDQVTDHNTVDAAVKFALSVAGETQEANRTRYKIHSLFMGFKKDSVKRKTNSSQCSYFGPVRHQEVSTCGFVEVKGSRKHGRQILHHRRHKCFMALSDVL